MSRTAARGPLERLALRQPGIYSGERFEQRLWTLEGRAQRMQPHRHLSLAEEVREALPKAQRVAPDELTTATAFGSTAYRGFENVRHARPLSANVRTVWRTDASS
jgi:hypothetical protein